MLNVTHCKHKIVTFLCVTECICNIIKQIEGRCGKGEIKLCLGGHTKVRVPGETIARNIPSCVITPQYHAPNRSPSEYQPEPENITISHINRSTM